MTAVLASSTAFVLLLTITAYSVAGGVDYGAGIWDLLAGRGARADRARALIEQAMAPVWEANNVWLVLAIVVCWTGFPLLFQSVFASLYPLFAFALLALILRGAFFAFRHVWTGPSGRRRTGVVFGISSVLAPFFFAAALGAIASGRVAVNGPNTPVWQACFNPTSIAFGLVSLAATAFIGASFLVGDARRFGMPDMTDYFRLRAVIATAVLIITGTIALAALGLENSRLLSAMLIGLGTPFAVAAVIATPVVGVLLWRGIFHWYRVLSVVVVGSLVFAWGFGQSPYLLPGQLTIAQSAAPPGAQVLLSIVTLLVVVLVLPSLGLPVYHSRMASAPDWTPLPHMISPMTEVEGRSALSPEVGTTRVEAFSDSVMAVIVTIMAFELRPPQGAGLDAMRDQLPGVLVYMLSFVFVGIYWNNHHHLLRAADRISGAAMWANLFLLFWLSLIPVLTEWVRDEYRHALPAASYGAVALAAGVAYTILVRALIQANGRESRLARAIGSDIKGYLSLVLYAAAVGLAFVSPWISYGIFVAVALMWFVPDRRFTRRPDG